MCDFHVTERTYDFACTCLVTLMPALSEAETRP